MALKGVREAVDDMNARRSRGGGGNKIWFKLADGETAVVRPLEQDDSFTSAYVHSVEKDIKGRKRFVDVPCLDQKGRGEIPCPGCEERAKIADKKNDRRYRRSYKFFLNIIWRNGPVYETEQVQKDNGEGTFERFVRKDSGDLKEQLDDNGTPVRADVLAVWSGGINAAEDLDEANTDYGGITSRDFKVKREGKSLKTKYKIKAVQVTDADGNVSSPATPLTDEDKKIAEGRHDFTQQTTPPAYDKFFGDDSGSAKDGPKEDVAKNVSPFRRRQQQDD